MHFPCPAVLFKLALEGHMPARLRDAAEEQLNALCSAAPRVQDMDSSISNFGLLLSSLALCITVCGRKHLQVGKRTAGRADKICERIFLHFSAFSIPQKILL